MRSNLCAYDSASDGSPDFRIGVHFIVFYEAALVYISVRNFVRHEIRRNSLIEIDPFSR